MQYMLTNVFSVALVSIPHKCEQGLCHTIPHMYTYMYISAPASPTHDCYMCYIHSGMDLVTENT